MATESYRLSAVDAIHGVTVLEDAVEQLEILGRINTNRQINRKGTSEMDCLIKQNETLHGFQTGGKSLPSIINGIEDSNTTKTDNDRELLCTVLTDTLNELKDSQTFSCLVNAVCKEESAKEQLHTVVTREEESRQKVRKLQRELNDAKQKKEEEIQKRDEMIAHLKDQLQEAKARTSMESKYIKKDSEVKVSCTQRQCSKAEQGLKIELESLRTQMDSEARVNAEIEAFLKTHHQELEQKVEFWMTLYDKDVEAKQTELESLKANRSQDLIRLQELTQKYNDYERVVLDDRAEKEKAKRRAAQEQEELNACIKVQSWWRGIMVRRQLGPYNKKKKKGKKGKKSGKGKSKKK